MLKRDVTRRWFTAHLALAAIAGPSGAASQTASRVHRLGILCAYSCEYAYASGDVMTTLVDALQKAGYVEGRNLRIDLRGAGVADDRLEAAAERLVANRVDVIIAGGSSTAVPAARKATGSIPIVMAVSDDADVAGFVGGLSRPRGNVTGISVPLRDLVTKQLQLVTEAIRGSSSVAVLSNAANRAHGRVIPTVHEAGQLLGLTIRHVQMESAGAREKAFAEIRESKAQSLLVLPDPLMEREGITLFALNSRMPTMFTFGGPVVTASGLMAYGPNLSDLYRRAATYVVAILKGTKPADLPVEQPTKFDFVVNRQTAKAIGLVLPDSLLLRADQIINE